MSAVTTDAVKSGTRPTGSLSKYSMDPGHEHHRHLSGAATPTGGLAAKAVSPWLCSGVTGTGRMKLKAT